MSKSIMQTEKECWVCHNTQNLHKHHVYGGGLRPVSDKNGFWVWLCAKHHNMGDEGVHYDRSLDLRIKAECQAEYEKTHDRADFMALIGRNWL